MSTRRVLGERGGMTRSTLDRIKPSPVPALLGAYVAVDAFRRAMRAALQVSQIDVVASTTGIRLVGVGRP
jgi:hypothetical protein